jgi:hypothetical protein
LVWQPTQPATTFAREPADKLPALGINGLDVSLLIASTPATAGYIPLSVMQSTGAVETSGVQQDCTVGGLNPVVSMRRRTRPPGRVAHQERSTARL